MLLQAAFAVLISRWSGESDIVIGTPIAGRLHPDVEPLIGFFVNTLVLRSDLSANPTFEQLLAQARATALAAYEHQEIPFEMLVDELKPARSLAHAPLFQLMFTLQNGEQPRLELPGLSATTLATPQEAAKFDLELTATPHSSGLQLSWTYAQSLFEPASVERLGAAFLRLLRGIAAAPQQAVAQLPLLSAQEREQVVRGFNATQVDFASAQTLPALFQAQVQRDPQAIALIAGGEQLNYAQLNQRANQLAHRLIGLGVRPDDRVAICVERGAGMLVGLLGILKAGAAYVPLDPAYPAERLAYTLHDCAPRALLSERGVVALLPVADTSAIPLLLLDDPATAAQPLHDPVVAGFGPQHLAYVIYTSGSTGQPKGVQVEHAAVVNHLQAHLQLCAIQPGERLLQFASYAFDASVEEIFPPLSVGATLVLRPAALVAPDAQFVRFLDDNGIAVVDLPTAFWHQWVQETRLGRSLPRQWPRLVILGGEKLERRFLDNWFALPGSAACTVLNTYGPTEATIYATALACSAAALPPGGEVSIGRPIANTQVYILDAQHQPVPVGVTGELYIGGAGVARGYLNRAELTAERFVADPFGEITNARLYKTGDLGRWLPDGSIEYLGRNDFQVKIRGFRIELGEIEAQLSACAGVREALVLLREDSPGERRLVAYVAAEAGLLDTLKAQLAEQLPAHMQPSAYVLLERLPLTLNGKVDRNALPLPQHQEKVYLAPQGRTETTLAAIWAQVLKLDTVGRDANFFDLGGHSLLATRVVSEVAKALGKPVAVRALFEHASLARLAAHVDAQASIDYAPIARTARDTAMPASYAQQRLWFIDRLEGGSTQYNLPLALRVQGELQLHALQQALDALLARHEVLRTVYADADGIALQLIQAPAPQTIVRDDLRALPADAREAQLVQLAAQHAAEPFDLSRDSMLRCRLVQCGERDHLLLFALHHIAADGWSLGVLVEEFAALYSSFALGLPAPLPALAVQYADYAAWQRERLQGAELRAHLDYWRGQLAGLPAVHSLPLDRPRPAQQRFDGAQQEQQLDSATLSRLNALARQHDASLFMLLQAAFALLLSRWSGETDIVMGTPIAGRLHRDVEPLIGLFVNTLVLRNDLSGDLPFEAVLQQARTTALAAYEHQEMPFDLLVDELRPARSLAHAPLFQVMFALQNTAPLVPELPGVRAAAVFPAQPQAKFDLQLEASENAQGLALSWRYASGLFDGASIAQLSAAYGDLLLQLLAQPALRSSEVQWLDATASRALRRQGRGPVRTQYRDLDLPRQIALQAQRTPAAIAVRCGAVELSYAELDAKAKRLAQALRRRAIGRGARVGIHLERSAELLIALVAVLKTGAAYVMLDHRQPPERLQAILADAGIGVVLLDSRRSLLPHNAADTVLLDDAASASDWLADFSGADPAVAIAAEDSAYVLYTSGSTGTPKGVEILHRGLTDYCAFAREGYYAASLSGSLVVTSPAFDLTVPSLYVPLLTGGCVELIAADDDLAGFAARL
ncbi:amino acid adenylation domain-containing protein, partial [Tahibacter aquaticus]